MPKFQIEAQSVPADIGGMKLCRIIYLSDAKNRINDRDLAALIQKASLANEARGISGLLLASGGHFMQVLEGDPIQLAALYSKISKDPRHTNLRQILHREIDHRLFPDWGMQLLDSGHSQALDHERIDKVLLRMRLKAANNDATEATLLLQEFRDQFLARKIPA